jgi:hypothetical protein
MKVQKNLNLEYEVVEKLNKEDNQTQLVESLLREHYDMEEENES